MIASAVTEFRIRNDWDRLGAMRRSEAITVRSRVLRVIVQDILSRRCGWPWFDIEARNDNLFGPASALLHQGCRDRMVCLMRHTSGQICSGQVQNVPPATPLPGLRPSGVCNTSAAV